MKSSECVWIIGKRLGSVKQQAQEAGPEGRRRRSEQEGAGGTDRRQEHASSINDHSRYLKFYLRVTSLLWIALPQKSTSVITSFVSSSCDFRGSFLLP